MAAKTTYPYDEASPTRPSREDLGGDDKVDDAVAPPGQDEPEAGAWNNMIRLLEAACKLLPLASVEVDFNAGAPYIVSALSMRTTIAATDFVLTDNAAGDTTLTWAVGLLPPQTRRPRVSVVGVAAGAITGYSPTALSVRVISEDDAGANTDYPFIVDIW